MNGKTDLDLKRLELMLDKALENETPESLTEWINNRDQSTATTTKPNNNDDNIS